MRRRAFLRCSCFPTRKMRPDRRPPPQQYGARSSCSQEGKGRIGADGWLRYNVRYTSTPAIRSGTRFDRRDESSIHFMKAGQFVTPIHIVPSGVGSPANLALASAETWLAHVTRAPRPDEVSP